MTIPHALISQQTPPPARRNSRCREMLQTLLAERFKLLLHRETRTLPLYELLAAAKGLKLQALASTTGGPSTSSAAGNVTAKNVSMAEIAYQISRWLSRPVLDKTGIKGSFDFTLQYDVHDSGERPSLFAALQEQLGLRLQAAKGPVEVVLVIDQTEKRSVAN